MCVEKYNIFEQIIVDKSEEIFFEIFKNESIKVEKIVSNGQIHQKIFGMSKKKVNLYCFLRDLLYLNLKISKLSL